ncbi:RNA-guided endonuclease TnpB family protein [Halorussus sp. MSC15.2]|uniref:RNA-guided endonuclease InsQ/TnpB family protein n=1 Tax=Halorussus sp. MSC15.2 TaxID=2283638 RepID=UPI0013D4A696|nr:RNA-guided endonuclease TnpB family protein [Halorussus sp. MSC15.2]NEU58430.1 IS200/IS605 family element transposase accessory protein TnpB [Halorussus sp. MSC15.2]
MADTEYCRRTAVTGLSVSPTDATRLRELVAEWKRGCQLAVNEAWGVCHTRSEVQQLTYDRLREETALGSQHAVLATHRAAEAIKRARQREGQKPEFTSPTVAFDTRTMTVFDDRTVSLTTTGERVRCDLKLPADGGYQSQYLDDEDWEPAKSTLHYRDGAFDFHVGFRTPKPAIDPPTEGATVLGVDLGVENLAVTSTAQFFDAGELNHRREEFERVQASLEATGTRSAARTLRQTGNRLDRFVRQRLHEVANGIVAEAERYDCELIAFGERSEVVEMLPEAGPFQEWLFERLLSFVEYRAAERGIAVVEVNPEYTSQRCMECGFTHPQNRNLDANQFECLKCEASAHDDYNAAKNIAFRCVRRGPLSSRGLGAAACALQSGLVTPDDGFTPYAELSEAPRSD